MHTYLSQFSFADIIEIESKDLQFVSLKNAWENILLKSENKILAKNIFSLFDSSKLINFLSGCWILRTMVGRIF
jgi:hypothetical protein